MGDPHTCPSCGAAYDAEFVVCVRCGMNVKTMCAHTSRVSIDAGDDEGEEEELEHVAPSKARIAVAWLAEYFPGFFRPIVLVASILLAMIGIGVAVFAVVLVFVGVLIGSIGAAVIGGLAYAQAIAWLLCGRFENLIDALTEFDSTQWTVWFILLMTPGSILIAVAAMSTN